MAYKLQTSSVPLIPPIGGVNANTSKPQFKLGTVVSDVNGNTFRYVQAKHALKVGEVVSAVAVDAWDGILINGAALPGTTIINVDTIGTARAANFYAGYWIMQAAAADKGLGYQIKSHPPFVVNGKAEVTLEGEIEEDFADNAALKIFNPYLVEKIDATTKIPRGVVIANISANYYGFIQIGGHIRAVKVGHSASTAIVVNEPLVPVAGNPGAMQGFAGALEANILEAALGAFISLDAVALNTPGYIPALIQGQL